MNRQWLQNLALERIEDAQALINAQRWSAAYYLAGYAVECGLKSCVLKYVEATGMIFQDRNFLKSLNECWTHDLDKLVGMSGLTKQFGEDRKLDTLLNASWGLVKDWKETSRYEHKTQRDTTDLLQAITNNPHGVLPWIQLHW